MQNKKGLRTEKIADLLHKELAGIIVKTCKDPRLEKITITNVKVSKDLSIAKIYFTSFNNFTIAEDNNTDVNTVQVKQVLKILNNASNFLRAQLANKTLLRKTPDLKFFYDDSSVYGNKIELLLDQIEHNSRKATIKHDDPKNK